MSLLLVVCLLLQPPGKNETKSGPPKSEPPARPSITKLLPRLKDLKPEQQAEMKKLNDEYAAMIADLETERDSKLAAVLTKDQRDDLARLLAEEIDRYRVVIRVRFNRPQQLFKPMKDILGMEVVAARDRINQTPAKPLAEDLPKAKADALLKAITAMGVKAVIEKQE